MPISWVELLLAGSRVCLSVVLQEKKSLRTKSISHDAPQGSKGITPTDFFACKGLPKALLGGAGRQLDETGLDPVAHAFCLTSADVPHSHESPIAANARRLQRSACRALEQ